MAPVLRPVDNRCACRRRRYRPGLDPGLCPALPGAALRSGSRAILRGDALADG
jgi:hypothetical protein